ncbi:glucosamine-6-phosphate deaminase [Terribacillus saccharophilus]|uniref:Glucosamine-6-phosphate deaminase n=1 Tax=Terribacillus saccharophilus TaxID=361277 RepID=A0A268AF54_9BACI|nr:glucosamine-6-phosphate deaminase [Terribacillus saccharophilus]PAD22753.1 glucosamine-6-phosphate deaminase [Terribacillus saccharophilus]PAF18048.1 glucosamine-6-phosphate deaminase [Terribacillus saccharophilus]PAF23654.1 glucosamine-6-phosphate deaminase [Terribacillus saccharophilus]PAF37331.1 glucosamine-6-phosphate deaminase [Terribacillus saccharophilus]PAF39828.1 glucosamine-6-phosphate deaminase [Terribacillus saccharophilus]
MLTMEKAKDYKELSVMAAERIAMKLSKKPNAVLGLATGSTPEGMYNALIEMYIQKRISFAEAATFNLDEYVGLHSDDENSYAYYMNQHLFQHIDLSPEKAHLPDGEADDMEEACKGYEQLIEKAGGIDLQVIGIGLNGHIGFNEPHTPFEQRTHVVELDKTTRSANARFFPSLEAVPTHAITMGIQNIMESKELLLLVAGEQKASVLERLVYGDKTEAFPASIIKEHPNVTIIADQGALSGLKAADYQTGQ